jgi:midasin (ATPase involved in ribosome maturation)
MEVCKKELAPAKRSRFFQVFVHDPEKMIFLRGHIKRNFYFDDRTNY